MRRRYTKVCKFRTFDYKKTFYFKRFAKVPYKDHFLFTPGPRLISAFRGKIFYVYGGKFWFKFRVNKWNSGLSSRFYI